MPKNPTMPGRKVRSGIIGRWRITEMEQWDRDCCDMEVPAFIEFRRDGLGEFQFGLVSGNIDHRPTERDNRPAVEWSWDEQDEMGPCCGRGWAVLEAPSRLVGRIFIHCGDDSAFAAKKR